MTLEYEIFEIQGKGKGNKKGNISFVQHELKDLRTDMKDTSTSQGINDSVLRSIQSVVIFLGLCFCNSSQIVQDKS